MPRDGWGAFLRGDQSDLEDWDHVLKEGFDPWIERDGSQRILRAHSFEGIETAEELRARAIPLIDILNGAISLSQGCKPVQFDGAAQFSKGQLHRTIFASLHVNLGRTKIRAIVTVLDHHGNPVPPPLPTSSDAQSWAAKAVDNELLADALIYFGRAADWFDTYKALECLEQLCGGERGLFERDWATQAEIKRLKQSANWERHARRVFAKPQNPMPFDQARNLLAHLLRCALIAN